MFAGVKYFVLALAVVVLFGIARHDLSNMRALTSDTSFFTTQLAEVTRLEKEMLQFRADANAYVMGHGTVRKEQMQLSFDLLWSRLNTQWSKFVTPRIDALRDYKQAMRDFAGALKEIDAEVQSLQPGDLERLRHVDEVMLRFAAAMTMMNQDAYAEMINRSVDAAVNQQDMTRSIDRFQWFFLIVCFSGFVILLWQLRRGERLFADLQKREAEIRVLATVDPLTGLNNRRYFDDRMRAIDEGHWPEEVQLLLIDLDGFKQVNDQHGHEAGDYLLKEVAIRIRRVVSQQSVLARLGGDEFGIFFSGGADQAHLIARGIIASLQPPVICASKGLRISTSIGITSRPSGPKHSTAMLREADQALYAAKSAGRNRYVVHGASADGQNVCMSAA